MLVAEMIKIIDEYEFASLANIIIETHGCRAVLIDFENRIINIEGPKDKELECIIALADQLGEYIGEPPEKKEYVTTLKGWPVC